MLRKTPIRSILYYSHTCEKASYADQQRIWNLMLPFLRL